MPKIPYWYRGWSMVALGAFMVMLTVGSVTYGYGIYVTPVSADLGLSRETMNSGLIFQHLGSALFAPFVGRMLDRVSVRLVVALAGLSLGVSLVLLGMGTALWPKAALILLPLSFGFQGAGSVASYVLVARWFKFRRGRAMALVAIGQTASSIIFAPIVAATIEAVGWRQAIMFQGIFVAVTIVLIAWLIVERPDVGENEPERPVASGIEPLPEARQFGAPMGYGEIIRKPVFWMLAAIISLTLSVVQATIASLVPLAVGRGLSLVEATTLLSSLGISGVLGKLVLAAIADKVDRRTLLSIALAMITAFTFSLTFDFGALGLLIASALCGMALGGIFPVYSAMLTDRFGAASLGTTEGMVGPMISGLSAVAVWVAGVSFDRSGDYRLTFLMFSFVLVFAFLLTLVLRFGMQGTPRPLAA